MAVANMRPSSASALVGFRGATRLARLFLTLSDKFNNPLEEIDLILFQFS